MKWLNGFNEKSLYGDMKEIEKFKKFKNKWKWPSSNSSGQLKLYCKILLIKLFYNDLIYL